MCATKQIILLARDKDRCQEICQQMQNFLACKEEKTEYMIVSTISNTREVVGHGKHGFFVRTAKDTEEL
jgi:hypothetical protein